MNYRSIIKIIENSPDHIFGVFSSAQDELNKAEVPHRAFAFSGSSKGATEGVPHEVGGAYDTTANGTGNDFCPTSKVVGETLEIEGTTWVVVFRKDVIGCASFFDRHQLILVPVEALE